MAALSALLVAVPAGAQAYGTLPGRPMVGADEAPPLPPGGAAVGFVPPERDEAGYRTPNRDLAADEAMWHVRVALNVAALNCRGLGDEDLTAAYNALIDAERAPLAAAAAATRDHYHGRAGAAWEARFDDDMTRLYNYFAQPPAHGRFCATAAALLHEAASVPAEGFGAFATAALPRLEAPFTAFYAAYDDYRGALANWRERHGPVVIATAAPVAVGPVAFMRGPAGPGGD